MQFNYDPSLSFYHLLYKCCLTPKYAISEEPRLRPRAIGLFDIITTRPARRSLLLPHFLVSTFTSISSIYRGISYSGSVVYGIFANTPLLMHSTTLATTVLILSRVGDVLSVAYRVLEYTGQSLKYVGEAFWQTCIEVGGFVTNFFSISFKPSVKPLYIPEHATGAASTMQYHVRPVTMMDRISNYLPTIPPSYVYGTALGITVLCTGLYYFTDMQRTVQDGVFTKSVDYVAQLQLSDVYAKRLAAFSEQYLMEKLKDLDTKIYQQLKQKSQKMRTSILECREMHDQILTLSSELERVQALNTVVHNISIE